MEMHRRVLWGWSCWLLVLCACPLLSTAAAPVRTQPYTESLCTSDPNVFFCEDFEGQDLVCQGFNNCTSTWTNPALESKDICFCNGGTHQHSTIVLPGLNQGTNRVWRISKTTSFTDIDTGINTGTGPGTIAGFLKPALLGTGKQEWYARAQIYIDPSQNFPPDIDYKIGIWALPRVFPDPPSAAYENGLFFHQDYFCRIGGIVTNFNDVLLMRYGGNFGRRPNDDEYCPPSAVGAVANNINSTRFAKGQWYTVEAHFKLGAGTNGLMELWIDGHVAYQFPNVNTCGTDASCPDMGYLMILGYMNGADAQQGYTEIDNIIYSRAPIGLPTFGGGAPPPVEAPTVLRVVQ